MTTIPIEVIVQDAEAPVVPSEDGTNNTERNIAVPDTGTISSSGDTSSSASSIVLPAILLVLAIGSIVAILIHKYHKQKKDKTSKKEKLAVATSSTIAVLAVTVLIGNLILPATKAATSDIADGITPAEDKVSIVVTRDGGVAEESIESTATITSTSDFGYKVLLSMAEGVETSNLYLDGDTSSEHYIASTESTELADNTWGYTLEEGADYAAVPLLVNAVTIAQGDELVEDETLSIYYGVMVSSDLPVGTYSGGEIEYTLTDNNFPSTLTTMQGMTTEICENTFTPGNQVTDPVPTATLIDSRDNKTYTIAKLADGNCWMTQNLDLDLSTEVTLTPADTDVSSSWTPERNTISPEDLSTDTWQYDQSHPYSYDPGDVYYYTSGSDEPDTFYSSLELCMEDHSETDCKYYHAGNYYNWSAAVASNDTSSMVEEYSVIGTSVCPKGWRIPAGPNNEDEASGEMYDMLASYSEIVEEGQYKAIRTKPFWLLRSGRVYYGGSVNGATQDGCYWSSTVKSSGYAHGLTISYDGLRYVGENRMAGYSVRCLAR